MVSVCRVEVAVTGRCREEDRDPLVDHVNLKTGIILGDLDIDSYLRLTLDKRTSKSITVRG